MNILCGKGQSTKELDYIGEGMVTSKVQLADFVDKLFWDIFARIAANPLIMFYPNFFLY